MANNMMLSADEELVEAVAEVEHDQWVYWAQGVQHEVSAERQARWDRLMVPYELLPEEVKDDDRRWARRALAAVQSHLTEQGEADGFRLTYWSTEKRPKVEIVPDTIIED